MSKATARFPFTLQEMAQRLGYGSAESLKQQIIKEQKKRTLRKPRKGDDYFKPEGDRKFYFSKGYFNNLQAAVGKLKRRTRTEPSAVRSAVIGLALPNRRQIKMEIKRLTMEADRISKNIAFLKNLSKGL